MRGGGRGLAWGVFALAVLLWPANVPGLFDGAPLDGGLEAVVVGLLVPILCWFHGGFLRGRLGPALILALALLRIADASFTEGGWCVRFEPSRPLVRDATGRPHSWDVRADWQAPDPHCSAVMTRGYDTFKRFPAWFFNLPPADNNLPVPEDRPPYATTRMTVVGFLDTPAPGSLDLQVGPYMATSMMVDGRPADPNGDRAWRIDLGPGTHLVQIDVTLQGNEWVFLPSWNQRRMGAAGFPLATVERPRPRDRGWLRTATAWSTMALTLVLVAAWLVSAVRAWGSVTMWAWAAGASAWLAWLAPRPGNDYVTSDLARWSVTALGLAALLPIGERLRTLRGAFVVIGIPWLVFIGVAAFDHVGKFSFYHGGDDHWMYQRFAYRIFLQGYWLEGGTPTFWFQPGYRWVAGALHMVFGDSSIGEFYADGVSLLVLALFAYAAVSRLWGFRWGIAAAALVLTLVMQGAPWLYWGVGLSENVAAGLIYGGALAAMLAGTWRLRLLAGVLGALGFFVRLNNLPLAFALAAFALPLSVAAGDLWAPRRWLPRVEWRTAAWVWGAMAVALFLFALRTWYYTGVFSVFHGTTIGHNGIWQPGIPPGELAWRSLESAWMVLSMNDPPRFVWYAAPMVAAVGISAAALARVPIARDVPLSLVLFFLAGGAGALVARGVAYSGRFSTILIASACAITVAFVARASGRVGTDPE
jgi:hypothetical protein